MFEIELTRGALSLVSLSFSATNNHSLGSVFVSKPLIFPSRRASDGRPFYRCLSQNQSLRGTSKLPCNRAHRLPPRAWDDASVWVPSKDLRSECHPCASLALPRPYSNLGIFSIVIRTRCNLVWMGAVVLSD